MITNGTSCWPCWPTAPANTNDCWCVLANGPANTCRPRANRVGCWPPVGQQPDQHLDRRPTPPPTVGALLGTRSVKARRTRPLLGI